MKKLLKILSIFGVIAFLFGVVSCDNGSEEDEDEEVRAPTKMTSWDDVVESTWISEADESEGIYITKDKIYFLDKKGETYYYNIDEGFSLTLNFGEKTYTVTDGEDSTNGNFTFVSDKGKATLTLTSNANDSTGYVWKNCDFDSYTNETKSTVFGSMSIVINIASELKAERANVIVAGKEFNCDLAKIMGGEDPDAPDSSCTVTVFGYDKNAFGWVDFSVTLFYAADEDGKEKPIENLRLKNANSSVGTGEEYIKGNSFIFEDRGTVTLYYDVPLEKMKVTLDFSDFTLNKETDSIYISSSAFIADRIPAEIADDGKSATVEFEKDGDNTFDNIGVNIITEDNEEGIDLIVSPTSLEFNANGATLTLTMPSPAQE